MTVREAFALAGHPVPEGAELRYVPDTPLYDDAWIIYLKEPHTTITWFAPRRNDKGWEKEQDEDFSSHASQLTTFDLSNLPAIDAYDALPEVVRAVVKSEPASYVGTEDSDE